MKLFAVIMAGGVGARFWPRSKQTKPKQLLRIFGEKSMIQHTVDRLEGFIEKENIFVITNSIQQPKIQKQLPGIPEENIIAEPFGKNTAPCIGLASVIVEKIDKDAVTITLPADHLIQNEEAFIETLKCAAEHAESSKGLVTLGINPVRPETGYGYIQIDDNEISEGIHKVLRFAEKPNLGTAKRFMESGDFFWNSGIFIWKVETILKEIEKYLPDLSEGLDELRPTIGTSEFYKTLANVYGKVKSISIDYGIMENSKEVYMMKGNFEWSDVGSWEAVYQLSEKDKDGNVKEGDVFVSNSSNSYVHSRKKFAAVLGMEDTIVIDTNDSLLVCKREYAQDVKQIVDYLKLKKRNELL